MSWLVAIFGLGMLVFLHELGHYTVARLVGIRPRAFYVGFPPAIAKVEHDGCAYGIGAIPLGGYVRIPGMTRPAAGDFDQLMSPALKEDPTLRPSAAAERGRLAAEDYTGARTALGPLTAAVGQARLTDSARRGAEEAVRRVDEGTGADAYWRQAIWKRAATISAGPAMNVLVAFLLFFAVSATGAPTGVATTKVAQVQSSSPADRAGLRQGDRIVAVDGRATHTGAAVRHAIQANGGRPLTVTVERAGARVTLRATRPVREDSRWVWGFVPASQLHSYSAGESARRAAADCWRVVTGTVQSVRDLFRSSSGAQVSGPVGIVRTGEQALTYGVQWYLELLAVISMSIALFNLIPLLPLDGGNLFLALAEGVRGKAIPARVYQRYSQFGMALLAVVFVLAFTNDLKGGTH